MTRLYRGYRIAALRNGPQSVRFRITSLHTDNILDEGVEIDLPVWDVMALCRGRVDLELEKIGEDELPGL